jgi:DNA-directed RNA polymerase sigma subunit (sigma70/sigma32)
MTRRQQQLVEIRASLHQRFGRNPSVRELAREMNCSHFNVWRMLKRMRVHGCA